MPIIDISDTCFQISKVPLIMGIEHRKGLRGEEKEQERKLQMRELWPTFTKFMTPPS